MGLCGVTHCNMGLDRHRVKEGGDVARVPGVTCVFSPIKKQGRRGKYLVCRAPFLAMLPRGDGAQAAPADGGMPHGDRLARSPPRSPSVFSCQCPPTDQPKGKVQSPGMCRALGHRPPTSLCLLPAAEHCHRRSCRLPLQNGPAEPRAGSWLQLFPGSAGAGAGAAGKHPARSTAGAQGGEAVPHVSLR